MTAASVPIGGYGPPDPVPTPPARKTRVVVARTAKEAQSGIAPILAGTNLIIWLIQYYGFNNNLPFSVAGALYVIIPAAIGWVATHVTVKRVVI